MATKIKHLKDEEGKFYPYTHIDAVVGDDGTKVLEKVTQLYHKVGDLAQLETTATDNLVHAINEAAQGGGGESGKNGVISQTQTWASDFGSYTMGNVKRGTIPQAAIDMFAAVEANFNETTGYFELNGLTDISYEEMKVIYAKTFNTVPYSSIGFNMGYKYATITGARTTLKNRNTRNNANTICTRDFLETDFEVLSLNLNWDNTSAYSFLLSISNATAMFHDSKKLKKIEDRLNVGSCNAASLQLMFANCKALRDVKVERLNADLSFSDCKYLTNASILYAIQYALTGAIKITLHADAYARATADSAITAALATKTNVTLVSA